MISASVIIIQVTLMTKSLISVIVPIYNVEKYIRQCLNTIINQSYKNLEIILVDDGTPDNSGMIAEEYARKDKRIRVLHKKNGGLSDARNAGIDIATGDYLFFVDSDDFLELSTIEKLLMVSKNYNADIVSCKRIKCTENDIPETVVINSDDSPYFHVYDEKSKMEVFLRGEDISTTAWGKLYKAKLFSTIRYPYGKYNEDVFTTYKLVDKANIMVCTNTVGYVYRVNYAGIMHERFSEKSFDRIEGKLEMTRFLEISYPDLVSYGYEGVIYACNHCYLLMCKARYHNTAKEEEIQKLYRKYYKFYLRGNSRLVSKLFAISCAISLRLGRMLSFALPS